MLSVLATECAWTCGMRVVRRVARNGGGEPYMLHARPHSVESAAVITRELFWEFKDATHQLAIYLLSGVPSFSTGKAK